MINLNWIRFPLQRCAQVTGNRGCQRFAFSPLLCKRKFNASARLGWRTSERFCTLRISFPSGTLSVTCCVALTFAQHDLGKFCGALNAISNQPREAIGNRENKLLCLSYKTLISWTPPAICQALSAQIAIYKNKVKQLRSLLSFALYLLRL